MSLVGSLEDLGLVDILQIVSLSRKSGMLVLRSESGDGRIVLRDGLVQGAAIKGEIEDLRSLLVAEGAVDGDAFDRARAAAAPDDDGLDAALGRECGLAPERLAALRRDHVERAVMRMFGWRAGEFSFEIRDDLPSEDRELLLPSGLNTQYLAMEATRIGDEMGHPGGGGFDVAPDDDDDVMMFSGEEPEPRDATHALALATASRAGVAATDGAPDAVEASAEETPVEETPAEEAPAPPAASATPASEEVEIQVPPPSATRVPVAIAAEEPPAEPTGYLVAVDANLSSLEWLKASVEGLFRRVHILQRRDAALDRIRQYLARGTVPMVLLADAPADRRGPDAEHFTRRLRGLSPSMPILALRTESASGALPPDVDGALVRPTSPSSDPDRWHLHAATAERLRGDLLPWLRGEKAVDARRRARGVLARLKRVSDRLRDPATQGEVLTLVLDYAAENFGRVAMFMHREEGACGLAQRGLPATGGPDDEGLRALVLSGDAMPALFRRVIAERVALRTAPRSGSDRRLVQVLGAAIPDEAYAAPIESGGVVVAIVYADNLPAEKPLPDTTPFEIVLHEAGLVLDRALLERALAERG